MSRIREPPTSRRGKVRDEFVRGGALEKLKASYRSNRLGDAQMDIVLSLSGIAFFVLMLGYVGACERF